MSALDAGSACADFLASQISLGYNNAGRSGEPRVDRSIAEATARSRKKCSSPLRPTTLRLRDAAAGCAEVIFWTVAAISAGLPNRCCAANRGSQSGCADPLQKISRSGAVVSGKRPGSDYKRGWAAALNARAPLRAGRAARSDACSISPIAALRYNRSRQCARASCSAGSNFAPTA